MRRVLLISLFLLAACVYDASTAAYNTRTDKQLVNIDDHAIYVVNDGWQRFAAWGGAEDRDGFVQYRQKRAIELVSNCRVHEVVSKKTAAVLQARVKC